MDEKNIYKSPEIVECTSDMSFEEEIWKEFNEEKWCFGCTNCNCN